MSNSYNEFAMLYDALTENVNYEARSEFISSFLIAKGITSGKILDLACGTGSFSLVFQNRGYDITGVDLSEEMLTIAQNKLNENAKLIKASIADYECKEEFDAAFCMLDSINHLSSKEDVFKTFEKTYNNLKNGGLFIFDVNSLYKHQEVLANNTFVFDEDDFYLVWDNELISDREVRIILDMFFFNGKSYDRYSEEWNEIAYSNEEIIDMLNLAGFTKIEAINSPFDENNIDAERIYFVCEK